MRIISKKIKNFLPLSFLFVFFLFPSLSSSAAMLDYCQTPPFIVGGIKPNLLLMLDNSASMYDLTYVNAATYCYDETYNNSSTYVGYFDANTIYQYNTSDVSLTNSGKFTSGATMPSSCTYGGSSSTTPYVCVNMSGTVGSRAVTQFIASGKFFNWLSASKLDVQKQILTGGKYDTTNSVLKGQSRGCDGSRFIKVVPAISAITFVARGPNSFEADYVNPSTQGGDTRIEIYDATYNSTACLAAVNDWATGANMGTTQTDTKNCIGSGTGMMGAQIAEYNHIIHNCYWYYEGHAMSNDNPLQGECENIYTTYYANNPASITNDTAGDAVCSSSLSHPLFTGITQSGYIPNVMGYIGRCACYRKKTGSYKWYWDADCSDSNTAANVTVVAPCALDGSCAQCTINEQIDFCQGITTNPVTDPSAPTITETSTNVPSFVMDAGISGKFRSGTFYVKVSLSSAPTGIIDDFKNYIRFGAMSFNNYGSSTECGVSGTNINCQKRCSISTNKMCSSSANCPSGETCIILTDMDGGKVIHHIGYVGGAADESVGNHSLGLIKEIDDIVAESWTPFAEAYYNSIGYYARTNAYNLSPGTSRTDLRINSSDFDANKNPSQYRCQQNHILIITDGMSTADQHSGVSSLSALYNDGDGQAGASGSGWTSTCPKFAGSKNLDDLAWLANHRNIKTFSTSSASTTVPAESSESIKTRVVYTGSTSSETGECNPETLMKETALNGCGYSDSTNACYQKAEASNLKTSLRNALEAIAAQAASGTAASVLASGEGSGANLIQALFYPERKQFGSTTIDPGITWTGSLKNLWYYMDPFFTNSIIMDDSTSDNILNLSNDCSITFTSSGGTTSAIKCGTTTIALDQISTLWEAGLKLFNRAPSDRKIYTTTDGAATTNPTQFTTPANATMQTLLQATGNQNLAERIISYVRGTDYNSKFCSSTVATSCTTDSNCPGGETCINYRNRTLTLSGTTNTWKLGDIISSTPKIVSWTPLNGYYKAYNDQSYKRFTESTANGYTSRGMVFTGANDGMLHAFYLGKLELSGSWQTDPTVMKAKLSDPSSIGIGKEIWGFIPKNALPYLKYMADTNYCHIYSIDATPYVFDASIGTGSTDISTQDRPSDGSTWRTILIGGMRLGGACKNACTSDINGDSVINSSDCVTNPVTDLGYSSYFALDITDTLAHPDNPTTYPPQLLWEFSDPTLGFATTGPAVVRIGNQAKNGNWFVVFGSGPTGPIDTGSKQFKGYSDQPLKLFVFDVKQGPGSSNANVKTITPGTAINYAFVGSLQGATIDINQNNPGALGFYQDDALYFGYTQAETEPPTAATKWTKGGVLRLLTKENTDPAQWALSTVIDNIGPVTTSVAKLQNYKYGSEALWLYFGTGRYYYKIGTEIDNGDNPGKIYGINDKCFTVNGFKPALTTPASCPSALSESDLGQATTAAGNSDPDGWYVTLDSCTDSSGTNVVACSSASEVYKAERVIASPTASSIGAVFFTTAKPSYDLCSYGGATHLWALDYKTGGAVSSKLLLGKALIQVSTGSIEQIDLSSAFTAAGGGDKDGRRTSVIGSGGLAVAPPPIIVPPKAVKRTIHMRER